MEKNIIVSTQFFDIFQNFNVCDQSKKMSILDKKELYLLLTVCLDEHNDEFDVVCENFRNFEKEMIEIFEIQNGAKSQNTILQQLIYETGDEYINTLNITNSLGESLPIPYTKSEIREIKINSINRLSDTD